MSRIDKPVDGGNSIGQIRYGSQRKDASEEIPPQPRTNWSGRKGSPLEKPNSQFCGLCATRIKGVAVRETRKSGANLRVQVWYYHDLCWRQFDRMRRAEPFEWLEKKPMNPETRFTTSNYSRRDRRTSLLARLSNF